MKVGSMFSGIGGIEIGFEKAGFKTGWFIERELYAQEILRKQFPGIPIYEDVTEIDFKTIPEVDIITGGFPCQDISNAGKRVGIEGSRSSLWKYMLEAISTIRPKFAFIENVSALLSRGLSVVLCDLASIGYDAEWYCVPASAVGAPHQRDRIFILAYSNSYGFNTSGHGEAQGKNSLSEEWETSPDGERIKRIHETWESCSAMENSDGNGSAEWNRQDVNRGEESQEYPGHSISASPEVADSCCQRLQRKDKEAGPSTGQGWWAAEPGLDRVANGVPNRVDRIKCLGNAVVPQVAEVFAQAIKLILEKRASVV